MSKVIKPEAKKGFDVVFDDESIIIIVKVAKLLVHPSPKNEKITLVSLLEKKLQAKVFPCHRLDRETTGLLVFAKDPQSQQRIMSQFKSGDVKKK